MSKGMLSPCFKKKQKNNVLEDKFVIPLRHVEIVVHNMKSSEIGEVTTCRNMTVIPVEVLTHPVCSVATWVSFLL